MVNIVGTTILYTLIGYLIGSISFPIIITKLVSKKDIRTLGSKNAGGTNVARNFGKKIGISVIILDALKTIVAIAICQGLRGISEEFRFGLIQMAGLGALIGHAWPLYFKFKGGKGVSCLTGYLIYMNWILFICALIAFLIILKSRKIVGLSSLISPSIPIPLSIILNLFLVNNQVWNQVFNGFNGYLEYFGNLWWIIGLIIYIVSYIILIGLHHENIKKLINNKKLKIIKNQK